MSSSTEGGRRRLCMCDPGRQAISAACRGRNSVSIPASRNRRSVFSARDWLTALTAHIPNGGAHLVRYYGWDSNVNRGERRKAQGEAPSGIEEVGEGAASAATRAWARLITQGYEGESLLCTQWGGPRRLLAFIEQPEVIEKIPPHLRLWPIP